MRATISTFPSCVFAAHRQSRVSFQHAPKAALYVKSFVQQFTSISTEDLSTAGQRAEAYPSARFYSSLSSSLPDASVEPWSRIFADGVTPYTGIVAAKGSYGTVVKLDAGHDGLIPPCPPPSLAQVDAEGWNARSLRRGDQVVVYVYRKNKDTGKINLALKPFDVQVRPLKSMIVDGRHPYNGVITSKAPYGFFVDIGFERQAFVPAAASTSHAQNAHHDGQHTNKPASDSFSSEFNPGDRVIVYITRHDPKSGKIAAALTPRSAALLLWKDMVADGQTPYMGRILGFCGEHAIVDIGCESPGLLALPPSDMLLKQKGEEVTVYIIGRERRQLRIFLALEPRPLLRWDDVIADGQTPYNATVAAKLSGGHYLVDIGCEAQGMLPAEDPALQEGCLDKGTALTVYVVWKRLTNFRMTVTTACRQKAIRPYSSVVADGITAYEGIVDSQGAHGTFVDVGCDVPGLLPRGQEQSPLQAARQQKPPPRLTKGEVVTVYVWYKQYSKLQLALQPRSTKAIPVSELRADGTTPVTGTVISQRDAGAHVDIGCESIGFLSSWDHDADPAQIQSAHPGDTIQVYVRGRNVATGKVNLALSPRARPVLQVTEVMSGGQQVYLGKVVAVERGVAFVNFGCEVTGMLPESSSTCPYRLQVAQQDQDSKVVFQRGEHLLVRPWNYDATSGRWILSCDGPAESGQPGLVAGVESEPVGNMNLATGGVQRQVAQSAQFDVLHKGGPASAELKAIDWKSALQHDVQACMKSAMVESDIVYMACSLDSGWVACVQVQPLADLMANFVFSGQLCPEKADAEQSAAEAAVQSLQRVIRRE